MYKEIWNAKNVLVLHKTHCNVLCVCLAQTHIHVFRRHVWVTLFWILNNAQIECAVTVWHPRGQMRDHWQNVIISLCFSAPTALLCGLTWVERGFDAPRPRLIKDVWAIRRLIHSINYPEIVFKFILELCDWKCDAHVWHIIRINFVLDCNIVSRPTQTVMLIRILASSSIEYIRCVVCREWMG